MTMIWRGFWLAVISLGVGTVAAEPPSEALLIGSVQVIDGDSFYLRVREIRLQGIDAPEWNQRCAGEPCGQLATAFLASLTAGREVVCRPDGRRSYGRVIARCWLGGADLGRALVAAGWAMDWDVSLERLGEDCRPKRCYSAGRHRAAEAEALAARRGAWHAGEAGFESPSAIRRAKDRK